MFRTARPGDLPALLALEAQFPGDRMQARQFRHHLANPQAALRVLVEEGAVLGYALVLVRAGTRPARLYSIAVDRRQRGRGLGAALLADAERAARRFGRDRLRLEVRADNAAAIALYEGNGYRRFGRHEAYYEDGGDALRFEKALPQGRASTASNT
jgi:ribosomal-protein-alanine N-acetyltransferase